MSDLDDLLKQIPLDQIASQLGVEPAVADAAVQQAVPALLTGLQNTAESGEAAPDLAAAVDAENGDQIVNSLFGGKTDEVATALSGAVPAAAVDQNLVKQLLPMLAPIVIAFVMKKMSGGAGGAAAAPAQDAGVGGALGNILTGALGGGNAGANPMGSILGSLLGGGGNANAGGGALGSILGGILGGKK